MIAFLILLYFIIGILLEWFLFEWFKQKTLAGMRNRTRSHYHRDYGHTRVWSTHHEKDIISITMFFTFVLWPLSVPYLLIKDNRIQNEKKLGNPMEYIVKEILTPRKNVKNEKARLEQL